MAFMPPKITIGRGKQSRFSFSTPRCTVLNCVNQFLSQRCYKVEL